MNLLEKTIKRLRDENADLLTQQARLQASNIDLDRANRRLSDELRVAKATIRIIVLGARVIETDAMHGGPYDR